MTKLIVHLSGGLGNNLYQFSIGYALSRKNNKELILDLSYCYKDLRKNLIQEFNIPGNIRFISNNFKLKIKFLNLIIKINKWIPTNYFFLKLFNSKITKFICEKNDKNNINFSCIKNEEVALRGFWQSIKYFQKYETEIKKILILRNISEDLFNFTQNIKKKNIIGLHIRGGDYLYKKNSKTYHYLDHSYYRSAINEITKIYKVDEIHVYSDDLLHSKKIIDKIKTKIKIFFCNEMKFSDLEEFHALQHYKYVIMSNSTYSWWSAYLSKARKYTIAPKYWFKNKKIDNGKLMNQMKLL